MSEHALDPTPGDKQAKRAGFQWLGAAAGYLVLTVALVVCALVISSQAGAITALSNGLSQQRSQFETCKNKPATAAGCTTPIAAAPSVIVKQGAVGPIGAVGAIGATGPIGPAGPTGPRGPQGVAGPIGKTGPPPGCALLSTGCIGPSGSTGATGPVGPVGPVGPEGKVGPTGPVGPSGPVGSTGGQGVQGGPGVGIDSTQCVNDDTPAASHWLITYKDGAQETSPGPCRLAAP